MPMLFPWLNKGLEYTPPKKREIMPIMKLLAYAQEHWAPYACHMIFVSVAAKVITSYYAYPLAVIATGALLLFLKSSHKSFKGPSRFRK